MTTGLWDRETFIEQLRAIGGRAYHDKHPFHVAMNEGWLSPEALRGWIANRFYYQQNIPIKDAAILANCPVREVRRAWIHRILDHDGVIQGGRSSCDAGDRGLAGAHPSDEGGIEAWLRLGEACGLSPDELLDNRHLLSGVRFAVDAYVNFARSQQWPIAIASSLTELFAPDLMTTGLQPSKNSISGLILAGWTIFAAESRRRGAILTRRSRLPWNIATHSSFSEKPCARSSSNAMSSGPYSTQFITPTSRRAVSSPPTSRQFRRLGDRCSCLNARQADF